MSWKQSLDRYLTAGPDNSYSDWFESVTEFIGNNFDEPDEFWEWIDSWQQSAQDCFDQCWRDDMNEVQTYCELRKAWDKETKK